jgi:hypothetical protein
MQIQDYLILASLVINATMLVFFIVQTRHLSSQTESLRKSIVYSSYQKLNDYINEINLLLLDHKGTVSVFAELDSIKERLVVSL